MLDRVIEISIRHRGLVILAGLVLGVWGLYAVTQTPMDAVPDLSENQVIVFTEWPGHSPREIEDQVTYPLSVLLQGLDGVRVVRGSSDFTFSLIHVIFDEGTDFSTVRGLVQERLAALRDELPEEVVPRLAPDAIATGQIYWYTLEGSGLDLGRLRAIQDWYVRHQLQSVPGVAEVASVGGQAIEYHVDLDPERMRIMGAPLTTILAEVARANATVGGHVIHKGNAEYIVRGVGSLGASAEGELSGFEPQRVLRDLERVLVPTDDGRSIPLGELAKVSLGAQVRRGILEKDGNEVVGGVVLMRQGHNPLEVTRRVKQKILELQPGLPPGARIVPCYDRTPLIEGAVRTVTATLLEAIVTASLCVLVILLHVRTSLIIAITLPLSALASFAMMWTLRRLGIADIQTNIMSLAGIAISIGVLVDSSIVMAENVMFQLQQHFGDRPVRGDVRRLILPACQTVGRPIFFSVMIMLISFLPVFALSGLDGKMFRPLAFTKTFALLAVAILSVTLVPALCTLLVRGRLRKETDSWLVRSVLEVYRPVLNYLLDRPAPLVWMLSVTFILGLTPLGSRWILLSVFCGALIAMGWVQRSSLGSGLAMASLVLLALIAEQTMQPLGMETRMPLDEGMVMDMPITIPRASISQSGDDVKARDMQLCRFPEVRMVVGKAGRAESAFDPAPLDMIETMIEFRPRELWPQRKLRPQDAARQGREVLTALLAAGLIAPLADAAAEAELLNEAVMAAQPRFDTVMRETAYQRNQEFQRQLAGDLVRFVVTRAGALWSSPGILKSPAGPGEIAQVVATVPALLGEALAAEPSLEDITWLAQQTARQWHEMDLLPDPSAETLFQTSVWNRVAGVPGVLTGAAAPSFYSALRDAAAAHRDRLWEDHRHRLDPELFERATVSYTRLVSEELLKRAEVQDPWILEIQQQIEQARMAPPSIPAVPAKPFAAGHHGGVPRAPLPLIDPHPVLDKLHADLTKRFAGWVLLWQRDRAELSGFGGELDAVMQMPGWANVWTMPIQNRVDMLATGVNTAIGIRVLGRDLNEVVAASEEIAKVVREIPGAVNVIADPIRGKGYLEIIPDRERAWQRGVSVGDINDVIETALSGRRVTTTIEGRERHPVRVRYLREWSHDESSIGRLPVPARAPSRLGEPTISIAAATAAPPPDRFTPTHVLLSDVAELRIVEGPATIKSENGLLRNYVRLNVTGRSALSLVDEARRVVAERVSLPEGVHLEWTGQFEHTQQTINRLLWLMPLVVALIFGILYLTYRDWGDACLMLLSVPGAIAGGIFFQWLFGYKFSVPVGVGYIACFGMATATGIIMLVYLRLAVEQAGGLERLTLPQLREAVLKGAVQRLRPKLLTEGTTILGLAPMLWATGVGADVIRPMAAPVIGGILIADEVIDLFLPVLFYWVRRRRWERLQRQQSETFSEVEGSAVKPEVSDLPAVQ